MMSELAALPLFSGIHTGLIEELTANRGIDKRAYSKNRTLREQNDLCTHIDLVYDGQLTAYALSATGSETIVFEFAPGSLIGANLLFGEHNRYPMNIFCTTDCELFHISKTAVTRLLHEYSFTMEFIKSLSLNSQGLNRKIAMYTQKSLRENLIDYLTALSADQKQKTITLPITKKQLADHLGVQRPSLFRELKRMKDEGLISVHNRHITLHH